MEELKKLEASRKAASVKLFKALVAQWPLGSTIDVLLNCKQQNPSEGVVVNHSGEQGTVRVRLTKAKKWGGNHVCDVHFSRVV